MRRLLLFACLFGAAGCGSSSTGGTGLEIVVRYDEAIVRELSVSGEASRAFGPYIVASATLPSGGIVSIRLDAGDAGRASVCAQGRDAGGRVVQTGCANYDVRAGEIGHGTLDLARTSP